MTWGAIGGAAVGTVGSMIGGGGGGGAKGAGHYMWKPAAELGKNQLLPGIQDYTSQYGGGQGLWSGSQLGAEDANVRQGQNALLNAGSAFGQQMGGVNSTLEGFLDYDPNSVQNQASRDALSANISAMFNESIRPGIEDRGTFSGQFGGPQQAISMGAATAPLSRAMADAEVGLMNADRQRAMAAMGMAPDIYQAGFIPGMIQSQVGDQRTQRSQLEQLDKIQEFEAARRNALQGVTETSGLINPLLGFQGTDVGGRNSSNPLQAALGGAMIGSQFGDSLGSLFGGSAGSGNIDAMATQDWSSVL